MHGKGGPVVVGEVIHHGQTVLSPRPRRRARWPWVLSVAWVLTLLCGGVPTVWIAAPVARDTLRAGQGASSPFVALVQWFNTFDNESRDGAQLADRAVVASQRSTVAKARADFLAARRADLANHPEITGARLSMSGPQPGMPPEQGHADQGTRADVLMYVELTVYHRDMGVTGIGSGGLPWRAEARKQRDGWRLYSVNITPYCGIPNEPQSGYSKC